MSVPDVAVAGALLAIERSATRWAVVVAMDEMLPALVSSAGLEAATVAVLAIGPVAAGLMCTTIVKGWVALGASVSKLQVTVLAVLAQLARAETKRAWVGFPTRRSSDLEVEGPLLVTVRV